MTHFYVRLRSIRLKVALLVGLAALICAGAVSAESSADPSQNAPVEAVWKPQRVAFQYRGYSTFYSCKALENKLEGILLSIGVREDIRLSGYACNEQQGFVRFEILFHSPVEATPENVRALTTYSTTDELAARTRGETLASATDLPRFQAQWQEVSFANSRRMHLEPWDCELVEAVHKQILKRMSVRILKDAVRCSPGYGNTGLPRLTVAALVPLATVAAD